MKILHLYANHKLTGPAELAILLAHTQAAMGHEVTFACPGTGEKISTVLKAAENKGLQVVTDFHLTKHFHSVKKNIADVRALIRYIGTNQPDIVHTHLGNDHFVGGVAARRSEPRVPVVRSLYEATGPPNTIRNRYLFSRVTDHLILPGVKAARRTSDRFALPSSMISVIPPAVDLKRFAPDRVDGDLREELELEPDDFVLLVASRIQRRRRLDILFDALASLIQSEKEERLCCVIVGRGTHFEKIVVEPAQRLKLEDFIYYAGYRTGDDYVRALRTADVFIQLAPGSDGTCRAARQAMAMEKPVVALRAGMADDLIEHGKTGYVVDKSPAALARMIHSLYLKPERAKRLGEEARRRVCNFNSPESIADSIDNVYRVVMGRFRHA
jgi:glycosyltransferase involved in cell wall biosynthesis